MSDRADQLCQAVADARSRSVVLSPLGLGSRSAFSGSPRGELLSVSEHHGIIEHAPAELVVTARAGTPVAQLSAELAAVGQQLAAEPWRLDRDGSVGGLVACNASGPARPFTGAVRDAVLGVEMVNGLGERCRFGGQVMKNVAGYDVARLQAGALGQFGVLLSVSFRLAPIPERRAFRQLAVASDQLVEVAGDLRRRLPTLSGLAWVDGILQIRLEGTDAGVAAALRDVGGEPGDEGFWRSLAEHNVPELGRAIRSPAGAWRLSLDPLAPLRGDELLVDWGGAVRWFDGSNDINDLVSSVGAFARRVGGRQAGRVVGGVPQLEPLRQRLQAAFDPDGVFRRAPAAAVERADAN